MITLYQNTNNNIYAISITDALVVISKEMYDCYIRQYRLMGWEEMVFQNLTHFRKH